MSAEGSDPTVDPGDPASRAHVVLLGTGGTIAGVASGDADVAYESGALRVEEILEAVPQVGELARISAESIAHVGSQDVDESLWLQLAATCTERLGHPGVGNGNVPGVVRDALAEVAREGVVVVRASRVGSGFVTRNVEIDDDELGFVAALDLSPQKSRILLQLALLETKDPEVVQALFSGR